jgi:hypothetical protein
VYCIKRINASASMTEKAMTRIDQKKKNRATPHLKKRKQYNREKIEEEGM